jgi:general stress protein YciG
MRTQKEYHYTYYSYEEWGRGYFGSRSCYCLPEEDVKYFGSFADKTFNPTQKIILKDDYETREEADADEIILHNYFEVDINPHFSNRSRQTSTKFRLPRERSVEIGKKNGKTHGKKGGEKTYELGIGLHARTKEQRIEDSKRGGNKNKELGTGICGLTYEQRVENGKKFGKIGGKIQGDRNRELGIGVCGRTKEQRIQDGKKGGSIGGKKVKELGIGVCGLTYEQRVENGKKGGEKTYALKLGVHKLTKDQIKEAGRKGGKNTSSQKWQCSVTGYISTPGGLSRYQKLRNIDTSKRKRIN